MKFGIRDDDICYFTNPSTIRRVYGDIWEKIPITTACVPFVGSGSDVVYETSGETGETYPISDNTDLISFLHTCIDRDRISVELHGYDHTEYNDSPEFMGGPGLTERINAGVNELESTFDTNISIFVPPHARVSRAGIKAISRAGLDIAREFSPLPREFQVHLRWMTSYLRMVRFYFTKGTDYRYPHTLDYGTHSEIYCHRMNENADIDALERSFKYVDAHDGNFCLSMHAGGLTATGEEKFREFVQFVRAYDADVQFVPLASMT